MRYRRHLCSETEAYDEICGSFYLTKAPRTRWEEPGVSQSALEKDTRFAVRKGLRNRGVVGGRLCQASRSVFEGA